MTITTVCAGSADDTLTFAWRIEQGEREVLQIPVLGEDGEPYDVTGWAVDAQIKTGKGGAALHAFAPEHITITGHIVALLVPVPVSDEWNWTVGWFRVVITSPNSDPADPAAYRIIQGPVLVDRG